MNLAMVSNNSGLCTRLSGRCALWSAPAIDVCTAQTAWADRLTVVAGHSELTFESATGVPVSWVLCVDECSASRRGRQTLLAENDGYLRINTARMQPPDEVIRQDTDTAVVIIFRSSGR